MPGNYRASLFIGNLIFLYFLLLSVCKNKETDNNCTGKGGRNTPYYRIDVLSCCHKLHLFVISKRFFNYFSVLSDSYFMRRRV